MRPTIAVATLAALLVAGGQGGSSATTAAAPCVGTMLSGTFRLVSGSAGAGNVVYALRLRNRSQATCFVSGLARLRLLGRAGTPLPTRVVPAFRGGLTAVRVVLRPGAVAKATARFSPDVPGPGEPVAGGQCEPTAYRVRVTTPPGGGSLLAPVTPPTPVCEHGTLQLSALSRA